MKGDTGITIPFVGTEAVIWALQMGSYRCRIHVGFCFLLLKKTATGPANVGGGDTTNRHLLRPAMENTWKMSIIALYNCLYNYRNSRQTCGFPGQLQLSQHISTRGIRGYLNWKTAMTIGSVFFRPRCSPIRIRCREPTLQTWLPLVTGNWYTIGRCPIAAGMIMNMLGKSSKKMVGIPLPSLITKGHMGYWTLLVQTN